MIGEELIMQSDRELRKQSQGLLSRQLGTTILVLIICGLTSYLVPLIPRLTGFSLPPLTTELAMANLTPILLACGLQLLIFLLYNLLILCPLSVGKARYFINLHSGGGHLSDPFCIFAEGKFIRVGFAVFLTWFIPYTLAILLFFLSAIVSFSSPSVLLFLMVLIIVFIYRITLNYFMVPYILSDNSGISPLRALKISKQAMKGHRLSLFKLHLSFAAWIVPVAIINGLKIIPADSFVNFIIPAVLFVITVFLEPAQVELYVALRENAIVQNICTKEDLALEEAAPSYPL